jgi:biopolymer transport protein ExbB/TolQ
MSAFETIQYVGDISPTVLAAGLRISFIAPVFGILIFLISRLEIFVLTILKK